jgi:L-ascorbate metabolism protein UlaG (beta-lactamase superfamily)
MAKLYYQGHGSYRFTTGDSRVIYLDPYAGDGYDTAADLILVTHGHSDHNQTQLVPQKPGCRIITNEDALDGGTHASFNVDGIAIEAVQAKNKMHSPKKCVGYLLSFDNLKVYCSGDTSKTAQMSSFATLDLDYAIFCGDGIFNMGLKEASACARLIGAKHNIIIHLKPGALFDQAKAEKWDAPNKVMIRPGEEITL